MVNWSPDAQMWFKRLFPKPKTVAALANSWKSERPLSVELHARQIVKNKFLISTVKEKCPFEKEYTAQSKFVFSCAYLANSEFKRVCACEPVLGREDRSCSNLTGQFDRMGFTLPSNTRRLERRP